jgi:hypothetical protein
VVEQEAGPASEAQDVPPEPSVDYEKIATRIVSSIPRTPEMIARADVSSRKRLKLCIRSSSRPRRLK